LSTAQATLVVASSPLYRTAPVGGPAGQPDYLNAVLELATSLPPLELLDYCRELEQSGGRRRRCAGVPVPSISICCWSEDLILFNIPVDAPSSTPA
jgi:2-amino-4-hydroxy-6-hydroxymethyldihydropteridine diphosphokinase